METTVTYTYAVDETKLRAVHAISGVTTTTDYCGNVAYGNNITKLLLPEEGYISLNDNKYHYYLKDHQGNNYSKWQCGGNRSLSPTIFFGGGICKYRKCTKQFINGFKMPLFIIVLLWKYLHKKKLQHQKLVILTSPQL